LKCFANWKKREKDSVQALMRSHKTISPLFKGGNTGKTIT
jgi:hypothetical protein